MIARAVPSCLLHRLLPSLLLVLALKPALAQTLDEQSDLAYGAATAALSQQNWAQAELGFERVLMFNPLHAEARIQLALLFAKQGRSIAAAGFLQSLIDDPRTPSAHRARLQTLLAQLHTQLPVDASLIPAPIQAPPKPAAQTQVEFSVGYTSNPYARADINALTLTLPAGQAVFAVDQSLSPAPLASASLSYLAPNQCGADLHHQSWGGSEPQSASRLLVFCYMALQNQPVQLFASTQKATDGAERSTVGASWPTPTWRLTGQLFQEPSQDRQGYALRLDHLLNQSSGTSTLLFAEAENASTGLPGYLKIGLQQAYPLTKSLKLQGQLSYQRDLGAYSPWLENGAARSLLLAQASLEHALGNFGSWHLANKLQYTNRTSNIVLFKFNELTINIVLKKSF